MPALSARLQPFLSELKHRRVFRVAVGYAVAAWCVVQVAFLAFPALLLPESLPRTVLVLALLGFPLALVLAWAYDITPEGVSRTGAGPSVAPSLEVTETSLAAAQPALPRSRIALALTKLEQVSGWALQSHNAHPRRLRRRASGINSGGEVKCRDGKELLAGYPCYPDVRHVIHS